MADRDAYISMSWINAFGKRDEAGWNPDAGFAANRDRILKLYDYYARVAASDQRLIWAALGRMAGGAVVGGLDFMLTFQGEGPITKKFVEIGRAIFLDLAWQHEVFDEDPDKCVAMAADYDAELAGQGRKSYESAWKRIRDNTDVVGANLDLLFNEQWKIIQPSYDVLRATANGFLGFDHARAFTNNIHPYHRPFIERFPTGDITLAQDRWSWIIEQDGMWDKWSRIPAAERARLNALSLDDDINGRWGTTLPEFLPVGSASSEDES